MTESTSPEPTFPKITTLKCVACNKALGTTAPVPRHDIAWCGCGGSTDIPGWFECPTEGLMGFRLFRHIDKPSWWKGLKARLPKIAVGFVGGLVVGTVLAVAIMIGTTLHTSTMAPVSPVPHVISR
jgi:hypothetical protein